jgi:hypothetical protein
MKMAVFCVVTPSSLVEVFRHFRGACCFHHQGDESETLVNFYQTTRRNNPEGSHLHTCRRENLKSHKFSMCSFFLTLTDPEVQRHLFLILVFPVFIIMYFIICNLHQILLMWSNQCR